MFVAGSIFYAAFDWRFLGLLYISIAVDYIVGRKLGVTDDDAARKRWLALSLVVQLGILGTFKYFDFFSQSASDFLSKLGLNHDPVLLRIALPVGVSFYTFQTLAYVITVYRREIEPEHDLVTFAAFVSWFPQLVAGPIERATALLPQVQRRRTPPDAARVESALSLILIGLFKKVVIADGVAHFVNSVFTAPGSYSSRAVVLAAFGFVVQVYGDFSGYSDIARGVSRLLGVELRRNFEQPFLSRNMQEFWSRWHTSLGWWFTEFVGRPLGGANRGKVREIVNVLIIFGLIGLWHGAAWTFVLWGLFNGVLVAFWRQRPTPSGRHPMKIALRDIGPIVGTFLLFTAGGILFRADSFRNAKAVVKGIVKYHGGRMAPDWQLVPIMLVAVLVLDYTERQRRIRAIERTRTRARLGTAATLAEAPYESILLNPSFVVGGLAIGALALGILLFSGGAPTPFIYFNF
ncbi:MAG: alginate O-acetyltransferase complex protein AlgI [Actinomycetota bacterium]